MVGCRWCILEKVSSGMPEEEAMERSQYPPESTRIVGHEILCEEHYRIKELSR